MVIKILLFSLIISIIYSKNNFGNYFNYKGVVYNPYRVFGLPPWSSMKKIKKKYNELVRKYHPDKSHKDTRKEFELVQQSFDIIKKKRKENEENDEEISFSSVLIETFRSILNVELIYLGVYTLTYISFTFQMLIVEPLFYMILSFTTIDNMIPHWFRTTFEEYLTCFIAGIILYIFHKSYIRNICKRTNKPKNN